MTDTASINISRIPKCVRLRSGALLRDAFYSMDRAAGGGASDGYFTAENFSYIQKNTQFLYSLKTFGQFKNQISQYIRSKACDPACRKKDVSFDIQPGENCIAPPGPKLPPLPSGPEQILDLSDFTDEYPPWFDQPPKPTPQRNPPVAYKQLPPIEDQIAQRFKRPSFDDWINKEQPGIPGLRASGPEVRFDGEYFIIDFHGCHVISREDKTCIADWSFFKLVLENLITEKRTSRHADSQGRTQMKIRAHEGDEISFYGVDPNTGRYSLDKDFFRILKGKVWHVRSIPLSSSSPKENRLGKTSLYATGIDKLLDLFTNPGKAFRQLTGGRFNASLLPDTPEKAEKAYFKHQDLWKHYQRLKEMGALK